MKIEHIAVGYNSEEESDKFFIDLLGLEKIRKKSVPFDLMEKFFKISKEKNFIVYGNDELNFEVFITEDKTKALNLYSHCCLLIENRDELVEKAKILGYNTVKVPRTDGNGYYLFLRDTFNNNYEIKQK